MTTESKKFYLPFVRKEMVAKDTYSFYFDRKNASLDFLPGQYIAMTLTIKNPDNRGCEKPFTIASSPLEKDYLMITTKIIESSFKKGLMDIMPSQLIELTGPWGGFVFKEEETIRHVFLAGGIGITPFHSMITYANAKKLSIPITLLVSFSTVDDLIFYKELSDIAKRNPFIKIVYTVSHPESSGIRWIGEVGRISKGLIKKYVQDIFKLQYFIVGPPAMVAAIEEVVKNMGVPNGKIFIENFTGY